VADAVLSRLTTLPTHCGSPSPRAASASNTERVPAGFHDMAEAMAFFASLASKRPCSQESVKARSSTMAMATGQRLRGMPEKSGTARM
jgi:hypothetical protein